MTVNHNVCFCIIDLVSLNFAQGSWVCLILSLIQWPSALEH